MDLDEYRVQSREKWGRAASGWAARRHDVQRSAMPVSRWLIDAARLQPGHTVLELAAGPGETGFLAVELVRPGGRLISSDFAEPMLDAGRERARELGIEDAVEFRVLDAEWIDLPAASVDAVLCRWGYMLMADPAAALRETRRVLRPGGRVSLAAWDAPERNPWVAIGIRELSARTGAPQPGPDEPGMFTFAVPGRIEALLGDAGFTEIETAALDLVMEHDSFEDWWELSLDCSRPMAEAVEAMPATQRYELAGAIEKQLRRYVDDDGRLRIPGRALVAAATA